MTLKSLLETTKHITFDGKNAEEIKTALVDFNYKTSQEANGKLSVEIDGDNVTIFKGDTIEFLNKKIKIVKPII